jgi:hypothetical protein
MFFSKLNTSTRTIGGGFMDKPVASSFYSGQKLLLNAIKSTSNLMKFFLPELL